MGPIIVELTKEMNMDFGKEPDATFDITFVPANKAEHKIMITNEMSQYDVPGVYVFFLKQHPVGRMEGMSRVIRIGATKKGLVNL